MNTDHLKKLIRDVPDFPKPGILFKDIAPIFQNPEAVDFAAAELAISFSTIGIDIVAGIESRGFLLGPLIAGHLNAKFVMIRKPGKLPGHVLKHEYDLEYGSDNLEIQKDAIQTGEKVLIHDDVLATGGTAQAAMNLIEKAGGEIGGFGFLIELGLLDGREKLANSSIHSVLKY
jgi:adenine phosphoribosyltransferase